MALHQADNRVWLGSWAGFAPVFVLLSLPAAGAALALPGQVGELAGIACILALAGLAAAVGHRWGLAVVLVADAALAADLWPIVIDGSTNPTTAWLAGVALIAAIPGTIALIHALPAVCRTLTGITRGRLARLATAASAVAMVAWMAAPALTGELGPERQPTPTASVKPISNDAATWSTAKSTLSSGRPVTVTSKREPPTRPISNSEIPADAQRSTTPTAVLSE